jgi:hypothetical protein
MASVTATTIRDRVAQVVHSDRRLPFLSKLAWELVIDVRARYPAPDTDAYRELEEYICLNEILHDLTSQLWSDLDYGRGGYPNQALVGGVISKSRALHCEVAAEEAFREAVLRTAPDVSRISTNGSIDSDAAASALLDSDRRRMFLAEWIAQIKIAPPASSDRRPIPNLPEPSLDSHASTSNSTSSLRLFVLT